jgi:predicted MFS family arabinose efflux permease
MAENGCGCGCASGEIKRDKLFMGSCTALIATAMTFAVLGAIMGPLKEQFLLSNLQAGLIGGAGLWGFPISILIFGTFCSALGFRFLLRLSILFFFLGVGMMIFATGFWMLFFGALTIAFANGLVEGACNPLVATLYPDQKTARLNNFHAWFPGGFVIGGLACFFLDKVGIASWQLRIGFILIPACISAIMMFNEKYPQPERAQSGVTFGEMVRGALTRPLFLIMFVCMMMTASIELGPNRWIPSVLSFGGVNGMLVLVWTSVLMAILRMSAGPIVHKLSPTGILLGSAVFSGIGLYMLSFASTWASIFVADTVFAVGVCFFWPTMLGVVSERVPKGGEFALALMGVAGNIAVGLITIPMMGSIADQYGHDQFEAKATIAVVQQAVAVLPDVKAKTDNNDLKTAVDEALALSDKVINSGGTLPKIDTANALRGIIKCLPADAEAHVKAKALLDPSELYGGRMSFRITSILAIFMAIVFGALFASDLKKGGYKAEKI